MRILHTADLHIGVENYGRPDPNTGLSTRLGDFLASLDHIVDYAIAESVDLVVLAGDVYKSRDPSQTHQREFAKRVHRLTEAGVPIFIVIGNHDLPNATGKANAVDLFSTLRIPHVHIGARLQTYTIPTKAGPIQILAVPWPRKAPPRGMGIDEARREVERQMSEAIEQEIGNLNPAIPAIIVGHVTVYGATVGSERSMMLGNDHVLLTSTLAWPQVECVALGHIHKYQVVRDTWPAVTYAGSIERVDFSEEGDEKGFMTVDWLARPGGGRRIQGTFHPLPARRFVTVDVEVSPTDTERSNPTEQTLSAIDQADVKDAVVRVRVKMPSEDEPHFSEAAVRAYLARCNAHYIAGITREITGRTRQARIATADGLQPMQALRLYFQSRSMDEQRQDQLVASAEALAREVGHEIAGPVEATE